MRIVAIDRRLLHQAAPIAIEGQVLGELEALEERGDLLRWQLLAAKLVRREEQDLEAVRVLLVPRGKLLVDLAGRASSRRDIQGEDLLALESAQLDLGAVHHLGLQLVQAHVDDGRANGGARGHHHWSAGAGRQAGRHRSGEHERHVVNWVVAAGWVAAGLGGGDRDAGDDPVTRR